MDKRWFELKGIRTVMLLLVLISLFQGAAVISQAVFLAKAISILFAKGTLHEALPFLLWFFTSFSVRHTCVWLQRRTAGTFAEMSSESVRERLLACIWEQGPSFAAKEGSGRIVTLTLDGIDRFRTYLELSIPRTVDMIVVTGAILVSVFVIDAISGLILIATMPILIGFFILLGMAARKRADSQWQSYRMLSHHFTDSLRGLQTLRFLGRSRKHAETVRDVSERYRVATMHTLRVAFLSSFALDFFGMLSVAFVAVGMGLRLVEGNMGLEAALAVLMMAPEYFVPVRKLGTDYHASLDGKEAWETIRAILDKTPEGEEAAVKLPYGDDTLSRQAKAQDVLILDNLGMQDDHGRFLLEEVSVTVERHIQKIGIVGMSGAGKTTLLRLLSGFSSPDSGEMRINGHSILGNYKLAWQSQIAYIPQHPYLFSQSLADNIRFYEPQAVQDKVEWAIDAVGLRELTDSFPNGSEEKIGEGGRPLSGGQAQRIALARALVSNRSTILLDEPTAHLDIETEWELKQTILSLWGDKRVFLATHRMHWMPDMDCIWVLHGGRLAEAGTHEELIASKGYYYNLLAHVGKGAQ